ncbi:MAG TPA: ComEC/Rec2 family competence protein [Candidatus Paceibacterota bacterium]|nr:ComEC/Rec2 family competence protein [Candidatus Paceibacterota bacterium]
MEHAPSPADFAFVVGAAFMLGILAASFSLAVPLSALAVVAILGIAWRFANLKAVVVFTLAAFFAGAGYFLWYAIRDGASLQKPLNREASLSGIIATEPTESAKHEAFVIDVPRQHAIEILAPPLAGFRYGDAIAVRGIIRPPDHPGGDPAIVTAQISLIAHGRGSWLRQRLLDAKHDLAVRFKTALPDDEAALLFGVTFGGSAGLSTDLAAAMATSGSSYVLAMYGFKMTAVISTIAAIVKGRVPRFALAAVSGLALTLMVLASGIEPAVVRAAIAVTVALVATLSGRRLERRNAITLAAAGMLVWNPTLLVFDAAFRFSFLSVVGMAYLDAPVRRAWGYAESGFLAWRDALASTIAVLAPIVPLSVASDGSFPLSALLSNTILFICMPLTMALGGVLSFAVEAWSGAAFLIARIASPLMQFEIALIRLCAAMPLAVVLPFGWFAVSALYYLALGAFAWHHAADIA